MLIIIISRSSLKPGHVGSKNRSLGQQATQVSDLGPLWPSCLCRGVFPHISWIGKYVDFMSVLSRLLERGRIMFLPLFFFSVPSY